jgi:hypothetical protein
LPYFASKKAMAKGKLTDDEIRWILSVDASQAQQSIHKLTQENKTLEQSNKLLRKEMLQLELQGKKNSVEYRNAEKSLKDNNRQLDLNRAKIREHEKTLGLENMTMKQLQKRAQDLQRQLDNTAKNLHPEEWNKLNSELEKTRKQMNELRGKTEEVDGVLEKIFSRNTFASYFGNMLTKATEGIMKFVSEGVNAARIAEGVERAFAKLDNPALLDNLRTATRGTVDDLTLMRTAVQANNFKIPLENLAAYLKFAQQRAQETGESVDYLVNSIITGIGRKSPLILDNLGISAAELNKEIKKTGDFAQAAGVIVERELLKQGDLMDTGAETAAARAAQLKNYQLEIGKVMAGIYDTVSRITTGAIVGLINGFIRFKNVIISLAAGVAASTVATYAKGLAHDVLAKKITLAYAAQEALRFAFMKTPWGLIISAIVAIGVALYSATKKTAELSAEQKMLNEVTLKAAQEFAGQKAKIEMLVAAIENEKNSNELRRQKINELREIMPSYNGMLDKEGKLINHNTEEIKKYLEMLKKQLALKAIEEKLLEKEKERVEPQINLDEANDYLVSVRKELND